MQEEMGMHAELRDIGWFQYNAHFANGLAEHEIDHVLVGEVAADCVVQPNAEEVQAWRWVTVAVLQAEIENEPEKFTPWLKQALGVVTESV